MPGLLQSTGTGVASVKFVAAFFAELIGVLIFTLYGSAVASTYGPWGNGITLTVLGMPRHSRPASRARPSATAELSGQLLALGLQISRAVDVRVLLFILRA